MDFPQEFLQQILQEQVKQARKKFRRVFILSLVGYTIVLLTIGILIGKFLM
jgi:ABC-type transporter lipoprotein component MlaA